MTATKPKVPVEGQMTLMEHLTELRRRLIISAGAVGIGGIIGWVFYNWVMNNVIVAPFCRANTNGNTADFLGDDRCTLLVTDPLEGLSVRMTVAAYTGLALAMPIILWQIWKFVSPGLYENERKYGAVFVIFATLLFASGGGLAYWSIPRALEFLVEIGGENFVTAFAPRNYVNFITKMIVGFGVGFQFPIVLIFLQMIGLVETDTLRNGRRFAIVGIVVLVAVLTPSGDPFTLGAMSVPMYLFYEIAIIYGRLRNRRNSNASKSKKKPGAPASK